MALEEDRQRHGPPPRTAARYPHHAIELLRCLRVLTGMIFSRGRIRRWMPGVLVAALVVTAAGADEPPTFDPEELDRMSLEEVLGLQVAGATKTGVSLERAPSWVTLIDRRQIEATAARSLPELLRRVAGVNVRWNPMTPTMTVRGFGQLPFSSRVLLLIDGVPQNSANKGGFRPHPLPDFFSLQHIEQIEVIRGPGAALYGENAFWGVINVVTRSASGREPSGSVEIFGGDRRTR